MQKIFLSILIISFSTFFVFAQQDTTLDELTAQSSDVKAAEIEDLNQKEEERTKEIANLLGFILPEYTDNPSYVITFKDPSSEEKGVEIAIDSGNFTIIKSPYTFPALSIGNHDVKFRFYDSTSTIKTLEYDLIIIPRAPIINIPEIGETTISISGTALANSDVIYTLSANAFNSSGIVDTDENGNWTIVITPEGGLSDAIYTFSALTRKYGYVSDLSAPITFTVGENSNTPVATDGKEIHFSFKDINKGNVIDVVKNNNDLLILFGVATLLGVVLTIIFKNLIDAKRNEKKYKDAESIIKKDSKDKDVKTLRELFGESDKKEESKKEEKEEEISKEVEPTQQESIINKDVFLKRFKRLDPDNDAGKETKKKIKISLTSKEE